ncbi:MULTISPECIES: LuxR C-terminal-related transcriptional regulator [unclassified Crossiella]|uniref:LuxR C-terminal-related transcriptional regulator n=1 Tax=unclassified Crossiella TaxID=2620835 RepID=UPI001FFFEA40|nr:MULTISPECIES: response regulator transcription factor [unclassified Crossiella]MCK2236643.1 response regulator transcription factor [Crossiella sp. S99.2]MCK2250311.1 response regulator transcription factor [Crossiella sp. S99.1]
MDPVTLRARAAGVRARVGAYRVAQIDAVPLFQHGVAAVLGRDPRVQWVGAASSPGSAVQLCRAAQPNVLLIDCELDPGAHLCRMLTGMQPSLVVMTLFRPGQRAAGEVEIARRAGAKGFLPRELDPARLPEAICQAVELGLYVDPALTALLTPGRVIGAQRGSGPALSKREFEVLRLIADGLTAKNIAHRLEVSEETVKTHVRRMLRKLDARDRAHAVALAYQAGLLGEAAAADEVVRLMPVTRAVAAR